MTRSTTPFPSPLGSSDAHRFRPDHLVVLDVRETEESRDVGIVRVRPQLVRRRDLDDPPRAHHANAIAEREGLGLVVRDVDRGRPELVEDAAEVVEEPIAQPAIERSERLVQQEDARLGSEGARECDPLLLAARQRSDGATLESGEPDELQELARPRGDSLGRVSAHPQPERDVPEDVAVREERVILEDEPDASPMRRHSGEVRLRRAGLVLRLVAGGPRSPAAASSCRSRSARGW